MNQLALLLMASGSFLMALLPSPVNAQPIETRVTASDGTAGDQFGVSVAIAGNYMIVGANHDSVNAALSGSAYIFRRQGNTWIEQTKLSISGEPTAGDQFGYAVDISADYAVAGAYTDDALGDNAGAAYVFRRDGEEWLQEAKLLASDGEYSGYFGCAVSISGDCIVIGAFGDNEIDSRAGAAYVFSNENGIWTETAKLLASDGVAEDNFGEAVSIDGERLLVSAPDNSKGKAYIYHLVDDTWTEQAVFEPGSGVSGDRYGRFVSIDSDYAVVGMPENSDNGTNSGSAFVYQFDGSAWVEDAVLTAEDAATEDRFGYSVDVSEGVIVAGAWGVDINGDVSGAAYFFEKSDSGWIQTQKVVASDGNTRDVFGTAAAISGEVAAVSAYFDDDNGEDSGSAYVFTEFAEPAISVALSAKNTPIIIPPGGGSFNYRISFTNNTTSSQNIDFWTVNAPVGGLPDELVLGPLNKTFPASSTLRKGLTQFVPNSSPGESSYILYAGRYPDTIIDSDTIEITKTLRVSRTLPSASVDGIPSRVVLQDNYPNPFNPETIIRFGLPTAGKVDLAIYDVLGNRVRQLIDSHQQEAGYFSVRWDGTTQTGVPVSSGIYFYRLTLMDPHTTSIGFTKTRKMLLAR